jgi:hypothetical protein
MKKRDRMWSYGIEAVNAITSNNLKQPQIDSGWAFDKYWAMYWKENI